MSPAGYELNVSNDGSAWQSEMLLDVNPTNALNLAGFSHAVQSPIAVDLYSTFDGGLTWNTLQIDDTVDGLPSGTRFDRRSPTMPTAISTSPTARRVHLERGAQPWSSLAARTVDSRSTSSPSWTIKSILRSSVDKWQLATGWIQPAE